MTGGGGEYLKFLSEGKLTLIIEFLGKFPVYESFVSRIVEFVHQYFRFISSFAIVYNLSAYLVQNRGNLNED